MKFLFVGLGSIGQRHLRNLYELGHRDFFAYRTNPIVDEFEKEIGVTRVASYDEGLALKPDAVFITNPTSLHIPFALKAAEKGCHIFIEKPLSSSLDGVEELRALAVKHKIVVYVGYQLRFHPTLRSIKELVSAQQLGAPIAVHIEVGQYLPDWHPGEDYARSYAARRELGGGAILSLIHELDYALWLFGPVRSLYALGGHKSNLKVDVEDVAKILLEFKSGVIADVHLDFLQQPASRGCKILFENGKIDWDYFSRALLYSYGTAENPREIKLPVDFEKNMMYRDEVKHFLDLIGHNNGDSAATLDDAIDSLKLALAALHSLEIKRPILMEHYGKNY